MSKKTKKMMSMLLVVTLIAVIAVGGMLAYLQNSDSDVNVMTLGEVKIEQHEYQRAEGVSHINGGAKEGDLVPFVQGQELYPAVPTADDAYEAEQAEARCFHWGTYSPGWNGLWDDSKLANVMDKFVFVENTGKSNAYYRTLIALECPEGMTIGYSGNDEINVNVNGNSRFAWDYNVGYITIEGTRYEVWCVTYNESLLPGEVSRPSLLQVVMTHNATNEDMKLLGDTYEILTLSQAVQTNGFDNAATALNTAFGNVNNENVVKWFGGMVIPTVVNTPENLVTALNEGKSVTLSSDIATTETINIEKPTNIDLNGHKLTVSVLEAKADTTISNGTLEHGKSTYPALSVSNGTLHMDDVDVVCEEYCSIQTAASGNQAAEYAALQVWSGAAVLDDCSLVVKCDTERFANSVFGVGIHGGALTMNGGEIYIENAGSKDSRYKYEAAVFAGGNTEKIVNLNNVSITLDQEYAKKLFAWGGKTVVNTTDNEGTWSAEKVNVRNGGTYEVNYK